MSLANFMMFWYVIKQPWTLESYTGQNVRFAKLPKAILGKIQFAGLQKFILGKIRFAGLQKVILDKIRIRGSGGFGGAHAQCHGKEDSEPNMEASNETRTNTDEHAHTHDRDRDTDTEKHTPVGKGRSRLTLSRKINTD